MNTSIDVNFCQELTIVKKLLLTRLGIKMLGNVFEKCISCNTVRTTFIVKTNIYIFKKNPNELGKPTLRAC